MSDTKEKVGTIRGPLRIVPIGLLLVNHDLSIAEQLGLAEKDRKYCGLIPRGEYAQTGDEDKKFPRVGTGCIEYRVAAWQFDSAMPLLDLETSVDAAKRVLGGPKELITLARYFPRPAFEEASPLVAPGQLFWVQNNAVALSLSPRGKRERSLLDTWLSPEDARYRGWRPEQWHLILEYLRRV